jgi:hypothetical protein
MSPQTHPANTLSNDPVLILLEPFYLSKSVSKTPKEVENRQSDLFPAVYAIGRSYVLMHKNARF